MASSPSNSSKSRWVNAVWAILGLSAVAAVLAFLNNGSSTEVEGLVSSRSLRTCREQRFSKREIARHNYQDDCWVLINGYVYDLTNFIPNHPGGFRPILSVCGSDATRRFFSIGHGHNHNRLNGPARQFLIGRVGLRTAIYQFPCDDSQPAPSPPAPSPPAPRPRPTPSPPAPRPRPTPQPPRPAPAPQPAPAPACDPNSYTRAEVSRHGSRNDCWVTFYNEVFDLTGWLPIHPGGVNPILNQCGGDGTNAFNSVGGGHNRNRLNTLARPYYIGDISSNPC